MHPFKRLVILLAILLAPSVLPAYGGPGLHETKFLAGRDQFQVGQLKVYNQPQTMLLEMAALPPWQIIEYQAYIGNEAVPVDKKGKPDLKDFPFKHDLPGPTSQQALNVDLKYDLGFSWGSSEHLMNIAVHVTMVQFNEFGEVIAEEGSWASGPLNFGEASFGSYFQYMLNHPTRGQFIDAPVIGLGYDGPTQHGVTGDEESGGGFLFFPDEQITFAIDRVGLGTATAAKKISPLDLFSGGSLDDPRVLGIARTLQSLDSDGENGRIFITPEVAACYADVVALALGEDPPAVDWGNSALIQALLDQAVGTADSSGYCDGIFSGEDGPVDLVQVSEVDAQANLESGINASGIFRKNISKTADYGESNQKLDVMPVYLPGRRSNGNPSFCYDENNNGIYDEGDQLGVPYEEWRLGGDPLAAECDPRDFEDPEECQVTLIECREIAKPIITAYMEAIDLTGTEFYMTRFSNDIYAAVSRDDGTTWKRMNVSRMADLSSFELETGEPFPGTCNKPMLKVNDNYVLMVWESKFCKKGNPRYAIDNCGLYPDDCIDDDGDGIPESVCRGNEDNETEVCEPDYPFDDDYYVTDIWGVRGQQQSVNYDEVDDVADLGIGEIPYSCLWSARGVIVTARELSDGTFASMTIVDDNGTPEDLLDDTTRGVELGDIVWFKPERLTSGRRDAYVPVVGSARGAGFAIAWQEDPSGLRPGKGKGPGQGWSGAISNHKTDIWYSFIPYDDFATVDANFVPGGPPESEGPDEKPGLGRHKAHVPFSLPVRVSDNDMVNTDTLKVEQSSSCVIPPNGTVPVCFPEVVDGSFVPFDPEEIASLFCGHPDADPATCCDPDNHEGDPNCEDLKGLYGNMTGTKRYAYLARSIDVVNNVTGLAGADGTPDYQYYIGGEGKTLDLCDLSGANTYMDLLPGTAAHERWLGFTNVAGASKLVCVSADGRLLDGDVSASRPNIQLQPYTKSDGSKSAWVLLGYEESKGMGHSLAAEDHDDTDNPVDEVIGVKPEEPGQDKGFKQDIGKNVIYHSFDFSEPDLVDPGHIVNLPALCGGLYPNYCGDDYVGDNPTCSCDLGQPVPLYFDYYIDNDDGTGEWMPDDTKFLQFRTEIARRVRFIMQSGSKAKASATKTLGAIIYKQGQEGQGRPADVFIRRMVLPVGINLKTQNPYAFENFECTSYLDETFTNIPECPNDGTKGYMCNVWGEAYGDHLCGGINSYQRRDHINLTSADIDLKVDAGPEDDTPDDPTDDVYGTEKVLLWTQTEENLGDESYGVEDTTICTDTSCAGMYSNARSHRGFIRGDFLATAYAYSPNWAAARNGRDRYNFYIRRSFDGGQTWTTTPAALGGEGVSYCQEWRSDPDVPDEDGTGNAPPEFGEFNPDCVAWCPPDDPYCEETGTPIGPGEFEPARKVSEFDNNKETSSDPRVGATPPLYPLDGRYSDLPIRRFVEDEYVDNIFFVAWGAGDNLKSTGGTEITPEAPPTDIYYTRSMDFGDSYLKVPWDVNGTNSNFYGDTVWRYQRLAWGEQEQGECQLRATPDGSKMYGIYHQMTPVEDDPDEPLTRWYPWEPEESYDNDVWFRRVIFWEEASAIE